MWSSRSKPSLSVTELHSNFCGPLAVWPGSDRVASRNLNVAVISELELTLRIITEITWLIQIMCGSRLVNRHPEHIGNTFPSLISCHLCLIY